MTKKQVEDHARNSLGYDEVKVTHYRAFREATIFLLDTRRGDDIHQFAIIMERDGTIVDDDIPAYKYWNAMREGKLTWDR